jgi:hypothetical protein
MGKNNEIKFVLMASGLISALAMGSKASACDEQDRVKSLQSLESLSPEQRIQARGRIGSFLEQHPNFDVRNHHFGVDQNGDIYVLDKAKVPHGTNNPIAQPSCVEGGS